MNQTFADFLRDLAAREETKSKAAEETIREWRRAIELLFDQLRGWLAESDPNGIIKIKESDEDLTEESLGRYRVPRLDLHVFRKWVGIIPKGRRTIRVAHPPMRSAPERATGRVDITDEVRRYVLYRFSKEGENDVWLIDDVGAKTEAQPLTKEAFEAALKSYLS